MLDASASRLKGVGIARGLTIPTRWKSLQSVGGQGDPGIDAGPSPCRPGDPTRWHPPMLWTVVPRRSTGFCSRSDTRTKAPSLLAGDGIARPICQGVSMDENDPFPGDPALVDDGFLPSAALFQLLRFRGVAIRIQYIAPAEHSAGFHPIDFVSPEVYTFFSRTARSIASIPPPPTSSLPPSRSPGRCGARRLTPPKATPRP